MNSNKIKKILWFSYDFPYPPTGGSISRDYNLIKQLSKFFSIVWVNRTVKGAVSDSRIDEMRKYCLEVTVIEWNYPHSLKAFFKSLFTGIPYIISRFHDANCEKIIKEKIDNNDFDIILCDHIYLAQYLPKDIENKIPVIANNEDNGFTYYKRLAHSDNFLRSLYAKFEWKRMLKYEVQIYNRFKNFITTSENEKNLIEHFLDSDVNIGVVRNGVDTGYFKPSNNERSKPKIVFTSWLKYYPNEEAAIDFAQYIFPKIKKQFNAAEFYIVGKEPSEHVQNLSKFEGVIVTGEVPDIRTYLLNARVAVVPLKVGGGTRLKILEAFASGIPVVSTSLGAEGLEVEHNKNILIANSHDDLAQAVISLLNDIDLSRRISKNALEFVKEKYDWSIIGKHMAEYIKNVHSSYFTAENSNV